MSKDSVGRITQLSGVGDRKPGKIIVGSELKMMRTALSAADALADELENGESDLEHTAQRLLRTFREARDGS